MKITSVELKPADSSAVCVLSFRDPRRFNQYNVKKIVGLDAEDIVPKFYGLSGDSSSSFYDLSLEKRDLSMSIELNPRFDSNETYSDLRDALYKMIASSRTGLIEVRFKNGTEVKAMIAGFVTKLEAPLFEDTPEIQIGIKCNDPMLRGITAIDVDVTGLDPAATNIQDILSTAPHGFQFEIEFTGALASFSMANPFNPNWSFTVTPSGGFLVGDVLHFSSEHKNKYLYVVRSATTIQQAHSIVPGSIWPILFPGDNDFACEDDASLSWNSISYYPTYWGV